MSSHVKCDRCGAERTSANPTGWSSIHRYARKVRPGVVADQSHLDICPDCCVVLGIDKL